MPESMVASLELYLTAAVLPAIFLVLWGAFRWRFNRALGEVMYEGTDAETTRALRAPRTVPAPDDLLVAGARPHRNQGMLGRAKRDAALLRRVFLLAGIVHLVLSVGVIAVARSSQNGGVKGAIGVAYYHVAPQLAVLLILLRVRWGTFVIAAASWFAGFVMLFIVTGQSPRAAVVATFGTLVAGSDNFVVPTILVGLLALRPLSTLMTSLVPLGFLMIAPAPFLLAWFDTLEPSQKQVRGSSAGLAAISLVIGVAVACWAIRRGRTRQVAWVFVALMAVAISALFVPDPISLPLTAIGGIGTNGLIVFLVAALFNGFAALKTRGWLTDDALQSVLCWGVLAIWSVPLLVGFDVWAFLPWVGYIAALIGGLFVHSMRRGDESGPRLVLLRVFGRSRQQRRLLDALDSTWRHVGRIDLIAGLDLAMPALSALALRDFLLSRTARWYVADATEAARRIGSLSSVRAVDGRFPINEVYAGGRVWRRVVELLVVGAECVLIDLRGFTEQNEGAAYELGMAIRLVPADRLVVLVDDDSDQTLIGNVAMDAWEQGSLPLTLREPLRVLVCVGREPQDSESIVSEVFSTLRVASVSPRVEPVAQL